MNFAIRLALGLLVGCCTCPSNAVPLGAHVSCAHERGEAIFFAITSTDHHSSPTPFRREQMTESLADAKEENDLDSLSASKSAELRSHGATSRQDSRLHSPVQHTCGSQQLHASVELRC